MAKIFLAKNGQTRELAGYKGVNRIHWNKTMLDKLERLYPTTKTEDLAVELEVSPRTVTRKARQLGLEKDPEWLKKLWAKNMQIGIAMNKLHPNRGTRNVVTFGESTRFKKGHKPFAITEEQMAKLQRRRISVLQENRRRMKKGLPKLTKKEKASWYRIMGL